MTYSLVQSCRAMKSELEANFCSGFAVGVLDTLSLTYAICVRRDFSTPQATAIARRYLEQHPENWDQAPSKLLTDAFMAAFPCRASQR